MTQDVAAPVSTTGEQPTSNRVCTLYVVRHGTTTMNVENRYRGRRDVPLDAQGYQDAVDAARQLSGARPGRGVHRPLRRTIATAQIIADEARVPDLRIMHGLNNVDYGAWEGMTAQEAAIYDPPRSSCTRPRRPGRVPTVNGSTPKRMLRRWHSSARGTRGSEWPP